LNVKEPDDIDRFCSGRDEGAMSGRTGSVVSPPHAAVDHVGVDLWRAFRSYEQAMFERVAAGGFADIVVSDSDVLVHVGPSGIRLADIARRMGLTKQAVHERVHSLIVRGYLELSGDPDDRRAKIVQLTARGARLTQALAETKRTLHAEIAATLGERGMTALRRSLATVETIARRGLQGGAS
jgi:DNA-binding MarR family transcriptional regulator